MTNTKFRKRALLSSVAMLLVALVALGSATFAWFTDSPNADASGISAYAQTSTGLVIKTDTDSTYSHHATLAKNLSGIYLSPATKNAASGGTFYTIDAADSNSKTLDTTKSWGTATMVDGTTGTGVYQETMTLKLSTNLTGSATQDVYLKGVSISLSNANHAMKDALVITLKYGSTYVNYSKSGAEVATWASLTGSGVTTTDEELAVEQESTSISTKVGTFNASTPEIPVEIYVWLNGEHDSVYSNNSDASQLISSIKIDFSTTA